MRKELTKLRQLQHVLWHALEDGEDHTDDKTNPGFTIDPVSFRRLDKLVPKQHPPGFERVG
jgi:hypothetical protein